ncbi:MAG: hypothetical protein KJO23_06055 [Bacteroidia bacterium]|nr:hypothetical protein [Bacteroidia bacterium]NNM23035.1 hypothetical protein [Flavobacteriaceae bacterium]
MNLWKRIRKLSLKQMFHLSFAFLKRPMLIGPTLKATRRTLSISYELFGGAHHRNGKANAFRHALWNILICKNVQKRTKNTEKSVNWAKKITFLYEKVTKNEKMDQKMDLHNNALGRAWFLSNIDENEAKLVDFIQKKLENARKIEENDTLTNYNECLIYISEEPPHV